MATVRFYKYVTPPKGETKITVGNKTVAGTSFSTTIKSLNSLGATVNSIAAALKGLKTQQLKQAKDAADRAKLMADQNREANIEAQEPDNASGNVVKNIAKGGLGFLGNLLKFFKTLITFAALDWLSKPENRESIIRTFKRLKAMFIWIRDAMGKLYNWITTNWDRAFGKDKTLMERIKGAGSLLAGAAIALAGLSFLTNPLGTIKAFVGIIKMVGGGIMNLGKVLGGTGLGRAAIGIGIGIGAYQNVMNDENFEGPEEDRKAAAIGAGVGGTGGAMVGGQIGAQFLGPVGGMVGSALGGFLGQKAGKFFGPIAKKWFEKLKEIFDTMKEWLDKFLAPLKDAFTNLFKALGPVIQTIVDKIKPMMPMIEKIMGFLGKIVFGPLILMMKGITALLKKIPVDAELDKIKTDSDDALNQLNDPNSEPELSKGGFIPRRTIAPMKFPEFSKGGWITGPQSGYPVSLDGKGVDFIGHGTEYVAKRSAGGFVIPVDTPHTRRDPGLTSRRAAQAQRAGFKLPGRSAGGKINAKPTYNVSIPKTYRFREYSQGGFFSDMKTRFTNKMDDISSSVLNMAENHPNENVRDLVNNVVIPIANKTGNSLSNAFSRVKDIAGRAGQNNLEGSVRTMVAQAMVVPPTVTGGGGGNEVPVIQDIPRNPSSEFLISRFGRSAEESSPVSNFL